MSSSTPSTVIPTAASTGPPTSTSPVLAVLPSQAAPAPPATPAPTATATASATPASAPAASAMPSLFGAPAASATPSIFGAPAASAAPATSAKPAASAPPAASLFFGVQPTASTTAKTTNPPPTKTIDIDPRGDVLLCLPGRPSGLIRATPLAFRTNSHLLAYTSPVFAAMLGPTSPFKEAADLKEHGSITVPLDDEDPTAMLVVLYIVHHHSDRVPATITLQNLWEIARIADKYDLAPALDMWVRRMWVPELRKTPLEQDWKWLAIACTFRLEEQFKAITKTIILESGFPPFGGNKTRGYADLERPAVVVFGAGLGSARTAWHSLVPECVLQAIFQERRRLVLKLLHRSTELLARYHPRTKKDGIFGHGPHICRFPAVSPSAGTRCDALILGRLLQQLYSKGFLPEADITTQEEKLAHPISSLKSTLDSIEIEGIVSTAQPGCCSHPRIGVSTSPQISTICVNCSKKYQHAKEQKHESYCNPLPEFRRLVADVYNSAVGLDLGLVVGQAKVRGKLPGLGTAASGVEWEGLKKELDAK